MIRGLRESAADLARRSVMGLSGAIFLAVALGFFTSAAWYALTIWQGPVIGSLLVGAFYLFVGLILLLLAREPAATVRAARVEQEPMQRVVTAFLDGVSAGARTRRPPRG